MIDLSNFSYEKILSSSLFSRLILAIIIIFAGFVIGRVVGRLIKRILHEIELNSILKKATKLNIHIEEVTGNFVTYFIYFAAVIMALNQIGLTTTLLNMIMGAVIVIIIISIFLGLKDFVPNIMAGIFIHQKRFIKKGDTIKVQNIEGKIIYVNLVETRVKTKQGDIIYIPNSVLTKQEFVKIRKKKK
ncbi:MAG: mechanosensitive ion channel [Nanoarchaeota archaeon]|nr:mechanosensitive ion channel [Nanoarchaeota archaeon]